MIIHTDFFFYKFRVVVTIALVFCNHTSMTDSTENATFLTSTHVCICYVNMQTQRAYLRTYMYTYLQIGDEVPLRIRISSPVVCVCVGGRERGIRCASRICVGCSWHTYSHIQIFKYSHIHIFTYWCRWSVAYRVAKTHRIPYLYRSISAKVTYI